MAKKQPNTTRSQIRSALRRLFLKSRERAAVLKEHNYSCANCGVKQSKAKGKEVYVEVHHKCGITNWDELFKSIYKYLLNKDDMIPLCVDCHDKVGESSGK